MTRDTVIGDTPANCATSAIVGTSFLRFRVLRTGLLSGGTLVSKAAIILPIFSLRHVDTRVKAEYH
jgi:hypothetical protein